MYGLEIPRDQWYLFESENLLERVNAISTMILERARALEEGKPEHILDKIIEGRMDKFYQDLVLMEQEYIIDDSMSIAQLVQSVIADLGDDEDDDEFDGPYVEGHVILLGEWIRPVHPSTPSGAYRMTDL